MNRRRMCALSRYRDKAHYPEAAVIPMLARNRRMQGQIPLMMPG